MITKTLAEIRRKQRRNLWLEIGLLSAIALICAILPHYSKNKRINLINVASGPQEALPMLLILSVFPFS